MPKNENSTLTLNVFSIPLLFLAAILLASSAGIVTFSQETLFSNASESPEVLSESDAPRVKTEEEIEAHKAKLRAEKAKMIEAQKRVKETAKKEINKQSVPPELKEQIRVQNKQVAPAETPQVQQEPVTDQVPSPQPTQVNLPIDIKVNGANLTNPSILNKMRVEMNKELRSIPGVEGKISKVELEESFEGGNYKGIVSKEEKILGLFTVSIPVKVSVDSSTGDVSIEDPSFWTKVVDTVSF